MINKEKKPPIDWLIEQCIKHQGILNMNQLLQAKEIEVDLKKEEFQKHFESKRNYGFFKIKKLKNIPFFAGNFNKTRKIKGKIIGKKDTSNFIGITSKEIIT